MRTTLLAGILLLMTMVCRGQSGTSATPSQSGTPNTVLVVMPAVKADTVKAFLFPDEARKKIAANLRTGGGLLAFSLGLSAAGVGFAANDQPEVAAGMGIAGLCFAFAGSVCIFHSGDWFLKPNGTGVGVTKKF